MVHAKYNTFTVPTKKLIIQNENDTASSLISHLFTVDSSFFFAFRPEKLSNTEINR